MTDDRDRLEEFRSEARAWLEANLRAPASPGRGARRPRPRRPRGSPPAASSAQAVRRRIRRHLVPEEYGGRGLSPAHERAFSEEARGYVMPDLGGAGDVTFGAIARSMLAHAIPGVPAAGTSRGSSPARSSGASSTPSPKPAPTWPGSGPGRPGTATLDPQRIQDLEQRGLLRRLRHVPGPNRLGRPQAPGPDLVRGAARRAGGHRAADHGDQRGAGFCEEFLDDVEVTDGDIIGEVDRAGRSPRPCWSSSGAPGERRRRRRWSPAAGPRPGGPGPQGRPDATIRSSASSRPGPHQRLRPAPPGASGGRPAARCPAPDPAVAAYGKLASGTLSPIRARIGMEIGGAEALLWEADDRSAADASVMNYLNGRMASIAGGTNEMQRNGIGERVLGLPREPSFDSNKPFAEVVRDARNWDGRVG